MLKSFGPKTPQAIQRALAGRGTLAYWIYGDTKNIVVAVTKTGVEITIKWQSQ